MRKYIKFSDNTMHELSSLTYDEFISLDLWTGASDIAFASWLSHNKLSELDSFNDETKSDSVIVVEIAHRSFEFNPSGDEKTWIVCDKSVIGIKPPGGGLSLVETHVVNAILKKKYGDYHPTV
jgi:hypothetical protein